MAIRLSDVLIEIKIEEFSYIYFDLGGKEEKYSFFVKKGSSTKRYEASRSERNEKDDIFINNNR
jgi:hypothetical protein